MIHLSADEKLKLVRGMEDYPNMKYAAMDADGEWYLYEALPFQEDEWRSWDWKDPNSGCHYVFTDREAVYNWKDTLHTREQLFAPAEQAAPAEEKEFNVAEAVQMIRELAARIYVANRDKATNSNAQNIMSMADRMLAD